MLAAWRWRCFAVASRATPFTLARGTAKQTVLIRHSCAMPFMLAAWRLRCFAVASRAIPFTLARGTGKQTYLIRHSCATPFMLAAWLLRCFAVASRATPFTLARGNTNRWFPFVTAAQYLSCWQLGVGYVLLLRLAQHFSRWRVERRTHESVFLHCLALTNICSVMVCCMRVCVFAMLYACFFVWLFGRDAIVRNLLQERRTLRDNVREFTIVVVITGVIRPVVLCIPVFGLCAMSSMYSRRFPLLPGAKSVIHSTQKGVW